MPLVFAPSLIGTPWVFSSWGQFLFGGLFASGWPFLVSYIRVCLFLVSLCSFRKPVCHGLKWIFKTSIHVCHDGLAFSNLVILECCSEWIKVYFHLRSFFEFFWCCIHIRLFYYVLFVHIFCFKIVLFPFPPFVGMSSYILSRLAGTISLRCFEKSCFVWIVLSCLDIF